MIPSLEAVFVVKALFHPVFFLKIVSCTAVLFFRTGIRKRHDGSLTCLPQGVVKQTHARNTAGSTHLRKRPVSKKGTQAAA